MDWKNRIGLVLRKITSFLGVIFFAMCVLSFTRFPFDLHRWLGTADSEFSFKPEFIIVAGGSGMPSAENLIRLYYAGEVATSFPSATVIILHPSDSSVSASMKKYLVTAGVDSNSIRWQSRGTNTREQALLLKENHHGIETEKIAVVTSPEHMYRTIGVFRKLGFKNVGGIPAFENAMFVDLSYDHNKVGGKWYAPDVSSSTGLRYNFWNYLKLQITCYRELIAIGYYKLNGWM